MISIRGIAMSLVVHGLAAAFVSVSAEIHHEPSTEDVPAIAVELLLEAESAPVMPSAPAQETIEAPIPKTEPEPVVQTASLPPPIPQPQTEEESEPTTTREMPVQIPKIEDAKPKLSEQLQKHSTLKPIKLKQVKEKPHQTEVRKPEAKTAEPGRRKQVAALAVGRGSVGNTRSTDGKAAEQSYGSKVLARLRAAKKYPSAARSKGIEGTAILTFTISSAGKLTAARVVKGAGHPLLDGAVLAMARDAAPFPAFPNSIAKGQMTFSVPVQFKIN